jgi:hypothetical protein
MNPTDDSDLKRSEEQKRAAMLDPAERWRLLQEMIAWADAQRPVPRNSRAGALAAERVQLARIEEQDGKAPQNPGI